MEPLKLVNRIVGRRHDNPPAFDKMSDFNATRYNPLLMHNSGRNIYAKGSEKLSAAKALPRKPDRVMAT